MPSWKKVITSGSNASLNSLYVTGGITGSLLGTASYAIAANAFPYTGSARITGSLDVIGTTTITGSLNITGSTTQIGNNTLLGNTILSGSIVMSGSLGLTPTVNIYGNTTHNGYIRFDPVTTNIDSSISASYIYVSGSTNDLYFTQNGGGYGNTTRLRWLEGNIYTGILYGGIISGSVGGTTFNVSAGSGIIVTLNASTASSEPYPTIRYVKWDAFSNVTPTYLNTHDTTWLLINSSGSLIQQTAAPTNGQFDTQIQIGSVVHPNLSTISLFKTFVVTSYGIAQQTYEFIRSFGAVKISGHTISASGSSLSVNRSSGVSFALGRNYSTDPNKPSYVSDASYNAPNVFRYYLSGSTFVTTTGTTVVDPTQYNTPSTATGLSAAPAGLYTIQRIFYFPGQPNTIGVYYGRATYNSINTALANLPYETFQENNNTLTQAIFCAYLVVKSNSTDLSNTTDAQFIQAGTFRNTTSGGGGGTIASLDDLSDVTLNSPANGDLFMYSGSQFINTKQLNGAYTVTGSIAATSFTGSLLGTSSYSITAATASYVNPLNQTVEITGSLQVQNNIDTTARVLIDTIGTSSLNWNSKYLYDNIGNISVDWTDKKLYSSTAVNSVLWDARQLIKSDGTTVTLDWQNATFTGSVLGTASFAQKASTVTISNDVDTRVVTANGDSTLNAEGNLTFNGQTLSVLYGVGDEGGEILLGKAATNTTLTGSGVTVDIYQNRLRFFEQGGSARGFYLDISTGGGGASTNLASGGGTVTSVSASGTVSGITLGGGPITGAGTLTLTGTISGLTTSNLSATAGILNAQLANSSITIGSTNIDLGDTTATLAGLTSISATSLTGSLLGTASYANISLSSSFATTASYYGGVVISASFATTALTASYVNDLNQNLTINGNFTVNGTASYTYITASSLNVGTNTISVNVAEPAERFGGLVVYDSGSVSHQATASLFWDSLHNHWVYQNASGSTYSGGMLLAGPRNTGSLGDEPNLTKWFIVRSDGGDHLDNVQIFSSASTHIITGSTVISGSLGTTGSFTTQTWDGASYVSALSFTDVRRGIFDVTGIDSIDADSRDLYDSAAVNSISWESRRLLDSAAVGSIRWDLRSAYDTVDSQSIAWGARLLKIDNGPASYTVNWGSGILRDTSAKNSVDWENRTTIDTSNKNSIDWQNRQLKNTSATEVLNWQSGVTITGAATVTGSLELTGSFKMLGAYNGFTGPFKAIEIDDVNFIRQLSDANAGVVSVDFGNRSLNTAAGGPAISWQGGNGTYQSNLYESQYIDSATRNNVFSFNSLAGQILAESYFDINVTDNDLVYLETDGLWYQVSQTNDSSTKMLAIAKNVFSQTGSAFIEGDITVTTGTGYPQVQSANYGLPVYIRESAGTVMSTAIPTSGYVRLLGHCYHNPGAGTEWIMKFRPSHEWIEL